MKMNAIILPIYFMIFPLTGAQAQEKPNNLTMEQNTNRPGNDYKNVVLPTANPNQCMELCKNDPKCKAYTYVKPGVQGPDAVCWLKNEVPKAIPNNDCVSGIRSELQDRLSQGKKIVTKTTTPLGKHGQVDAIPINIPWPRPDLPTSRSEILQSTLQNVQIRQELERIAQSRNFNINSINTFTLSGLPARSEIYNSKTTQEGSSKDSNENLPDGMPKSASEVDWSGGIQTSVNFPSSKIAIQQNGKAYPVVTMKIFNIVILDESGLDEMARTNTALIGPGGSISLDALVPNQINEPYMITVDLRSAIMPNFAPTLDLSLSCNPETSKLLLSPDKTKYFGLVNLKSTVDNVACQIRLEFGGADPFYFDPYWYFSGITIMKL